MEYGSTVTHLSFRPREESVLRATDSSMQLTARRIEDESESGLRWRLPGVQGREVWGPVHDTNAG